MGTTRWFYPNISGVDAEELLFERGVDGSFLVRPSEHNPGDFSLSVRRNHEVTHIRIQNTGDFYYFYCGEKFATLAELVQFYTENQGTLKEKSGEVIHLKCPLYTDDPTTERWFHGRISGKEAEKLLQNKHARNGSFLVRESYSHPGHFVLCVKLEEKVTHVIIRCRNGKFDVGGGDDFDTLSDLIEHYRRSPMVEASGNVIHLRQPINTTKIIVSGIKNRIIELERKSDERKSKTGFCEEFETLQQMEYKNLSSRVEGTKDCNKHKNRFKHILPFDYTRVILKDHRSIEGSDYINANFVCMKNICESLPESDQRSYIATQGCLEHTIFDFWRMIWQENSTIIIMITKEVERGKNKCAKYWPDFTNQMDFNYLDGKLVIKLTKEWDKNDYVIREFSLKLENFQDDSSDNRVVYQFHFTTWPDHGVLNDPEPVLRFLLDVSDKQKSLSNVGPLVVHCSAGSGRTGTFIVIDMILCIIENCGMNVDIDIMKTVQTARSQRSGLVQTEAQYRFVYQALRYYTETILQHKQTEKYL